MFRKANKNDVKDLQKLLVSAFAVTYEDLYSKHYINKVSDEFYNFDRLTLKTNGIASKDWSGYYVLEIEGDLVGCVGGGIPEEGLGEIYVLYLKPNLKRRGYGSILVDEFTKLQQDEYNITRQRVAAAQGNSMGIPFYEKQGFVENEIREVLTDNEIYYSLVMYRDLNL